MTKQVINTSKDGKESNWFLYLHLKQVGTTVKDIANKTEKVNLVDKDCLLIER